METRPETLILLPYQRRWLNDRSPLKIWLAARQTGKSFAVSMEAVAEALGARSNNMLLSSSERQSREVMRKVVGHLRCLDAMCDISPEKETSEEVVLENGSRIISLPANPDTVRGFSGNVFMDEFAFHRDAREIWRAMYPAVTRGFLVRVASTPNGRRNMFHDLWEQDNGWSKHRVDIYGAAAEGLAVDIAALRRGINDPVGWAQEFECKFLDEATAFLTYETIAACEDEGATVEMTSCSGTVLPSIKEIGDTGNPSAFSGQPAAGREIGRVGEFYLGVDVGRRHDLTVFWLWEKAGDVFWTRMVREMRDVPFAAQREFLYSLLSPSGLLGAGRGAGVRRACIDSTGIGAQMAEEAASEFGHRVEPVSFTSAIKEDLAVTLRRAFEDRTVRVPPDSVLREDLHSVRRFTTASGAFRYDAERSGLGHADRFWAAALGLHAALAQDVQSVHYESAGTRALSHMRGCW